MDTFRGFVLLAMFACIGASVYNKPKAELVQVGRASKGFHYHLKTILDVGRHQSATKVIGKFIDEIPLNFKEKLQLSYNEDPLGLIAHQLDSEKESIVIDMTNLKKFQYFEIFRNINGKSHLGHLVGSATYPVHLTLEEHLYVDQYLNNTVSYAPEKESVIPSIENINEIITNLKMDSVINVLQSFKKVKLLIKGIQEELNCVKEIFQTLVASKKLHSSITKLFDIREGIKELSKIANSNNHTILIEELSDVFQQKATFVTLPNGKIQIQVTIEAKEEKTYNLYSAMLPPMPIFDGKGYIFHQSDYVIGKYVNFATHTSKEHIILSKESLKESLVYDKVHIIFEEFHAISDSNLFSKSCEDHLDQSLPKEAAALCSFVVVPNTNHVYTLNGTMFAVVTETYEKAVMDCKDKDGGSSSTPVELKVGMTIINLGHTCQLVRHGGVIRPSTRLPKESPNHHHLTLKLSFMDQLQDELEERLDGFQFMHTPLDKPIDLRRLEWILANERPQSINFIVCVISIIASVSITLILVFSYKSCKGRKEMQKNHLNTDVESGTTNDQRSETTNIPMETQSGDLSSSINDLGFATQLDSSSSSINDLGFATQLDTSFAINMAQRELPSLT